MPATEWRNEDGHSKWQPTTANGSRLWWGLHWGGEMSGEYTVKAWSANRAADEFPYPWLTWRRRAERIARREDKRRLKARKAVYNMVRAERRGESDGHREDD